MAKFATYSRDTFPDPRLTRSEGGVLEMARYPRTRHKG